MNYQYYPEQPLEEYQYGYDYYSNPQEADERFPYGYYPYPRPRPFYPYPYPRPIYYHPLTFTLVLVHFTHTQCIGDKKKSDQLFFLFLDI
ncbi:hypothetical protein AAAC51_15725 [Priestia megaterium]